MIANDQQSGISLIYFVVSLHPTFVQNLDDAFRRSHGSQTTPVEDEGAFDWDLSDRADIETQTNPPTRYVAVTAPLG